MDNPFEVINTRLERIEQLLEKLAECNFTDTNSVNSKPMTVKELGNYLSLSIYTIYGLTHKRSIPFIKKGKRLYFEKNTIDKWLKNGKQLTNKEIEFMADDYLFRNPL